MTMPSVMTPSSVFSPTSVTSASPGASTSQPAMHQLKTTSRTKSAEAGDESTSRHKNSCWLEASAYGLHQTPRDRPLEPCPQEHQPRYYQNADQWRLFP